MNCYKYLLLLFGLLLPPKTYSQTNTMKEIEFTEYYLKKIQATYPQNKYQIFGNLEIHTKTKETEVKHFLDNAYREYVQTPDDLEEIINRFLLSAVESYKEKDVINPNRIIPIIKPKSYISDVKGMQNTEENRVVYEKYNEELVIIYAEDKENSISYFDKEDFKKLSIKKDSLRDIAIENLFNILPEMEKHGNNQLFMLTAGGDFEVNLILLDIWSKENFPVNGEFVIGIPNRDLLFITGSEDKQGIEKLKKMIPDSYNNGNYPISTKLFIRKNDCFIVWEE